MNLGNTNMGLGEEEGVKGTIFPREKLKNTS